MLPPHTHTKSFGQAQLALALELMKCQEGTRPELKCGYKIQSPERKERKNHDSTDLC